MMAVIKQNGGQVTTAVWDGRSTTSRFAADVPGVTSHATPINYVSFLPGAVPAAGGGASEHLGTCRVAYSFPGIRDWVMRR